MGEQGDIGKAPEGVRDSWFAFIDIQAGTGNATIGKAFHKPRLVNDIAAGGIHNISTGFHLIQ